MARGIDDNELEQEVKNVLDNGDNDITVELSNLSESAYHRLKNKFSEDYQVKGIVNILRIREPENIGKKDYTLHISRGYEDEIDVDNIIEKARKTGRIKSKVTKGTYLR